MEEYIHIEPMVLPLKDLQQLLRYFNQLKFAKAKITTKEKLNEENLNTRNVGSYWVSETSYLMTDVFLANYFEFICRNIVKKNEHKIFNNYFSVKYFENFEILKYDKDHKFTCHKDHGSDHPRTLSFVFILNDDYEGGDLIFHLKNKSLQVPRKPNQLIVFPSNGCFPHEVTPITKGTRYSVVTWAL